MPAAIEYSIDKDIREAADQEFNNRRTLYVENQNYYKGKHHRHLKVKGGVDDNVVRNLCRQAVDRTKSFLVPEMPTLELPGGSPDDQTWLNACWSEQGGATLLSNLVQHGALAGQVFARIVPADTGQLYPRIVNLKPSNVIVFWDGDDFERVLWYELRWTVGGKQFRQDVIHMGNLWRIVEFALNGSRWDVLQEIPWAYPLGPVIDWQHLPDPDEHYGEHELEHAVLNDAVNKSASDIKRILRYHAHPRTIGTGFEAKAVQETAVDGMWTIPNEAARVSNLEMQSDLASSMNYMQVLSEDFFRESRVTIVPGGLEAFRGMTNLGIRAAFMDMVSKNETLRRQYGRGIKDISRRLLMVADKPYESDVISHWGEALPVDRRETVQLVDSETKLGVLSKETASAELGRDYQAEQQRILDEASNAAVTLEGAPVGVSV